MPKTSLALGVLLKTFDMKTSLRIMKEAGFDSIDFPIWHFCLGEDAPLMRDDWCELIQDTVALIDEAGLTVGQAHAYWQYPHHLNEDYSFELPGEIFLRNIEACRILGTDLLVFHPLQYFYPITDLDAAYHNVRKANAAWFAHLLPAAEKFGVQLLIENTFDYKHIQSPEHSVIPFSRAEDILYVIDKLHHPLVQTCLDTGHASIAGQDVAAMIRMYGDHLKALHLQDNFGKIGPIYEDIHMIPGNGRIPWPEVFAALKETGFNGALNLELNAELPGQPAQIQLIRLKSAREIILAMAETY